ncbi:MAG: hypothetical protein E6K79_02565 [Candidatus Eisenbacteria bacterium]|uniref:Uncharacterized protein n=1 Tax=Eiseniibacteriota bacterium TaxID=2212470 RepID=A0A538TRK9_UNCEI|nr:MAG: hypothetical protein E6K79_02565 [Candidatus Eisenbacteria bacterium]
MCFIGHGAFGIITKPGWVPFFQALGINEATAFRLMPIIGTSDITMAIFVLLSPCRIVLAWMSVWALFTSLLRPMAGQGYWEVIERAGNYGIPLAFLVMSGWARSWREWFEPILPRPSIEPNQARMAHVAIVLRITTGLLLIGHGGYGAFMHKQMLADQYASVGLSGVPGGLGTLVSGIGWFDMFLGAAVLVAPLPALLLFIFAWKVATEMLYPVSGAPFWEFIERGGSYGAPLALFFLISRRAARDPIGGSVKVPAREGVA